MVETEGPAGWRVETGYKEVAICAGMNFGGYDGRYTSFGVDEILGDNEIGIAPDIRGRGGRNFFVTLRHLPGIVNIILHI
jgi:hypothetical protein